MAGSQAAAASPGRGGQRSGVRFCGVQEKVEDVEILINTHRAGLAQGPTGCHGAGGPRAHGRSPGGGPRSAPGPARLPRTGRALASQGPARRAGCRRVLPAEQDGVGVAGTRGLSLPCRRPRRQRWGDPPGKLRAPLRAAWPLAPSGLCVHVHPHRTNVLGRLCAAWELWGGTSQNPKLSLPGLLGGGSPDHTAPCLGRF